MNHLQEACPLEFSDACLERCPRVSEAVMGALAKRAMSGDSIDPAKIRASICDMFAAREEIHWPDGKGTLYDYSNQCAGPIFTEKAPTLTACGREEHLVAQGGIHDEDYIEAKQELGIN